MKRRESRLRGKKVRDCRKAVLLWDEGLSYPLNTSVCAAARRTWCTRVDVGVCTCTLRYREVAAATAME